MGLLLFDVVHQGALALTSEYEGGEIGLTLAKLLNKFVIRCQGRLAFRRLAWLKSLF